MLPIDPSDGQGSVTPAQPVRDILPAQAMAHGGTTIIRPGAIAWGGGPRDALDRGFPSCEAVERSLGSVVRDSAQLPGLLAELTRTRLWVPLPKRRRRPFTDGTAVMLPLVSSGGADFVPCFTSLWRLTAWADAVPAKPGEFGLEAAGRPWRRAGDTRIVPHIVVLATGLARRLPPVQWAIPDILPEGLTLLAGKPKLGKSWLALAMALAVASGGVALGTYPVTQGEVLYLALEDNERRLQSRAQQLLASMSSVPNSISFELRWPRLDQGGLLHLEEYLQTHPDVRLVVIDTWARVSPKAQHRQRSQYEDEYAALTPLKYLADTYRVSILAIHHLRKMRGDDVLDEITGSIGLTGAVDGALILKRERGQHEASLFVTGRDIEHEQQLALRFDAQTAMWMLVGNAEEVKRTKERQDILDLLSEQFPEGMTPRQVAEALDKNYHTTRCLLRKMEVAGEIQHTDSQYVAIPRDNAGNQSDYTDDRNQRNHRNQCNKTVPSTLQRDDQVARGEESCLAATDYGDYTDYAHERVSANVFQTRSIPPPFGGCSLQFPSASEDVLSQRENIQDAQDDPNGSVINRNQRNQSMSVTTQTREHVEPSSANTDYGDYTDYGDGVISVITVISVINRSLNYLKTA